ncbi:DedA family protein [bacterium]|nr:DedA family protein [bacterium]
MFSFLDLPLVVEAKSGLMNSMSSGSGHTFLVSIFVLLLLGGIGFPIPEDLPLLLAGVALSQHVTDLWTTFLVCYVGVMVGDQAMYFMGYRFGTKLLSASARSDFFPALTEDKLNEIREGLRRKRLLYIFIGRHLFPIRSVTFLSAGALRVPFFEFLLADGLAALVSVSIMLGIGYFLGGFVPAETVEHFAHEAHIWVGWITAILVVGGVGYKVYHHYKVLNKK